MLPITWLTAMRAVMPLAPISKAILIAEHRAAAAVNEDKLTPGRSLDGLPR